MCGALCADVYRYNMMMLQCGVWTVCVRVRARVCERARVCVCAHEMAVCHNPHNSSNWEFCITRQLDYKHTICENVVSTEKCIVLLFT